MSSFARLPYLRSAASLVAIFVLAAFALLPASTHGQGTPSPPDFALFFGMIQDEGANIMPENQPVLALVGGHICGTATTSVAAAVPGNPAETIGKTVYTVQVMADGSGLFQAPGCGTEGAEVRFYFPEIRRFALETGSWTSVESGDWSELNLTMGGELAYSLALPLMARDTSP